MNTRAPHAEVHDRAWDLLPWLVNGRLDQSDGEWLMRHVGECEECARELRGSDRSEVNAWRGRASGICTALVLSETNGAY